MATEEYRESPTGMSIPKIQSGRLRDPEGKGVFSFWKSYTETSVYANKILVK